MLDSEQLRSLHIRAKGVAQRLRLPFRRHTWKGLAGNWLGVGLGSSIDFQDHRPYLPGDDPRYIDWQAYARTGHYTMKLYREEVSPCVDVILDVSHSMQVDDAKRTRTAELLYFALESAWRTNSSVHCFAINGGVWNGLPLPSLLGYRWELPTSKSVPTTRLPDLTRVPLRQGSMRVFISDLLFPEQPEAMLVALRSRRGRGVIWAPYSGMEAAPEWKGNVELLDCETQEIRRQHVHSELLRRYVDAYRRHFELWMDSCRRFDVIFSRCAADSEFFDDLYRNALRVGAVETWN